MKANPFGEKFVRLLGQFIERVKLPQSIRTEAELELAILPHLKRFVEKELGATKNRPPILYHHGRTTAEKRWWTKSKPLQTVGLFGTNVSDMFIAHPKVGAVAIELKYAKDGREGVRLTSQIQRAIGQSLIATLRHPFAVCAVVYKSAKKAPIAGLLAKLKKVLWEKHRIYLIVRGLQ